MKAFFRSCISLTLNVMRQPLSRALTTPSRDAYAPHSNALWNGLLPGAITRIIVPVSSPNLYFSDIQAYGASNRVLRLVADFFKKSNPLVEPSAPDFRRKSATMGAARFLAE